ncbi:MAG: hypothetical protein U0O22_05570 [Acutalibacteraceae bacterium]
MPKPDTDNITIRINDFAKNMVDSNVDADRIFDIQHNMDYYIIPNYCREIAIGKRNENAGDTLLFSDYFCNDYDYNSNSNYSSDEVHLISNKITHLTNRGHCLFTLFNCWENDVTIQIREEDVLGGGGVVFNFTIPSMSAAVVSGRNFTPGLYYIFYDTYNDEEIGRYKAVKSCNRYNLHYVNAKGGYDTLPIDGKKDKRTDNLTFEYFKSKGNNQSINKPQMNKFKVDVTPKWELQTGWLNDEQSQKMYNLFTSQKVWLEDIDEGTFTPVYITNNSVEYKTFTNNGKRKVSYTIGVTSCNTLVKF